MKTGWEGFHPVYVYVYSKPLTKPEIPSGARAWYSQANQDKMILELMKATVEHKPSSTLLSNKKSFFVIWRHSIHILFQILTFWKNMDGKVCA